MKEKTRCNKTMTESAYWSWISRLLRRGSFLWAPYKTVRERSRRPYTGPNKKYKWEYQCNSCKRWFTGSEIEIDHIVPCGTFDKQHAGEFIEKLFCEEEHLQVLCKTCHKNKTIGE